jgi:hypothetical protein
MDETATYIQLKGGIPICAPRNSDGSEVSEVEDDRRFEYWSASRWTLSTGTFTSNSARRRISSSKCPRVECG